MKPPLKRMLFFIILDFILSISVFITSFIFLSLCIFNPRQVLPQEDASTFSIVVIVTINIILPILFIGIFKNVLKRYKDYKELKRRLNTYGSYDVSNSQE